MSDTLTTYRTVTPYLLVPDAALELTFLSRAFGATEVQVNRTSDGRVAHAEIRIGDTLVMLGQAGGPWTPKAASLYLWVPDVDATYATALAAGATSESEPEDKPYGHRNAGVIDPGGNTWWIGSPTR